MKKSIKGGTFILAITMFFSAHLHAAEDTPLLKDLTAVIALLALPCGEVVSARKIGDNDHVATCKDGMRYRVYVNAEGRVVAQKQ